MEDISKPNTGITMSTDNMADLKGVIDVTGAELDVLMYAHDGNPPMEDVIEVVTGMTEELFDVMEQPDNGLVLGVNNTDGVIIGLQKDFNNGASLGGYTSTSNDVNADASFSTNYADLNENISLNASGLARISSNEENNQLSLRTGVKYTNDEAAKGTWSFQSSSANIGVGLIGDEICGAISGDLEWSNQLTDAFLSASQQFCDTGNHAEVSVGARHDIMDIGIPMGNGQSIPLGQLQIQAGIECDAQSCDTFVGPSWGFRMP